MADTYTTAQIVRKLRQLSSRNAQVMKLYTKGGNWVGVTLRLGRRDAYEEAIAAFQKPRSTKLKA